MAHLRTARRCAKPRNGTTKSGLGQIVDAVSIRRRPAEVEDRAVPGHWKETFCRANNTHIVTLVERQTRFAMLLKVPSKDTATVVAALGKHVRKLPPGAAPLLDLGSKARRWLTTRAFTIATNVRSISAIPRSPWQRGSNGNTNGFR